MAAYTKDMMLSIFGPSLKYQGGKGQFTEVWGSELELLDIVNKRLEGMK
jgi:hypothetical protein